MLTVDSYLLILNFVIISLLLFLPMLLDCVPIAITDVTVFDEDLRRTCDPNSLLES